MNNELYEKVGRTFERALRESFTAAELEIINENPEDAAQAYLDALGEALEGVEGQ